MALVTGITLIPVIRHLIVLVSQFRGVVVFMAIDAAEHHKVAGSGMAIDTVVPFASVFSAENGEIHSVVVKSPASAPRRVAGQTGCIFIDVAAYASVLSIRFVALVAVGAGKFSIVGRVVMTIGALRPLAGMFAAVNRENGVVLSILGRHPVHISGMALGATGGKVSLLMIRRPGAFVIHLVAGEAVIRGIGKTSARMALGAVGNIMPLGEREKIVVDELGRPVKAVDTVAIGTIG